jgi:hypothetical protein
MGWTWVRVLAKLRRIFCSHNEFKLPLAVMHKIRDALTRVEIEELAIKNEVGERLRFVPV